MQAQVTHEWVTYRQAEEITGLSRTTLRKLVGEGEIRIRRVGRAVRINRAGWSVGLVRECLSVIASAAGEDLEELMVGARERARLDVISAKSAAGRVEEQLQNMRRERLLPDDRTLEKVSRYEAHLSRLMFKALHELEALQVRRAGGRLPWPASTWTDWRRAKGKAFTGVRGRRIFRTSARGGSKKFA